MIRVRSRLLKAGAAVACAVLMPSLLSVPPASAVPGPVAVAGSPSQASSSTFAFVGAGWGHGLGMSQYGACGMAQAGRSHQQILGHFYQGTQLQNLGQPGNIRVRVAVSAAVAVAPLVTAVSALHNGTPVATIGAGETVMVVPSGSGFVIHGKTGQLGAGTLSIPLPGGGRPVRVTPPDNRFDRGQIVFRNIGGALQVTVEGLGMQDYLYGLAEVPTSWPAAALRAQAIAGRSYAKATIDRRRAANPSRTWDIDGTTSDQVYDGFDKEQNGGPWLDAVNATASTTVTYGGAAVQAFYSSSDGGHTENNEYVWGGTPLPYLRGVADPWDAGCNNPNAQWSRSYTGAELGSWFGIGTATSVVIYGDFGVSGRIDRATVRLVGTTATKTVTGASFRSTINQHVPRDRRLLSTLVRAQSPVGVIDQWQLAPPGVRIRGWTLDPETADPIVIHVYAGSRYIGGIQANLSRPDVGAVFPGLGSNHGFDLTVPIPTTSANICVYALNVAGGRNTRLGCQAFSSNPRGAFDRVRRVPAGVRLEGWALDPNTAKPLTVHVYRNGSYAGGGVANTSRPDVAGAYPAFGSNRGFDITLPPTPGPFTYCVFALNTGPGTNTQLGCPTIVVSVDPFGAVDRVSRTGGNVRIQGWAIDPDSAGPAVIHAYAGQTYVGGGLANLSRPDVGTVHRPYGLNHGFDFTAPVAAGMPVCVFALNVGTGSNALLGCGLS